MIGASSHAARPKVVSWADIEGEINSSFNDNGLEYTYSKNLKIPLNLNGKFEFNSCRGICCDCILLGKNNRDEYYVFHRCVYNEEQGADMLCKFFVENRLDEIKNNIKNSKINAFANFALPENWQLGNSVSKKDGISLFYSENTKNKGERIIEYPLCLPNRDMSDLLIVGEKDGQKYVKQWPKWLVDHFSEIDKNTKLKLIYILTALVIATPTIGIGYNKLRPRNKYVNNNKKMNTKLDFSYAPAADDDEKNMRIFSL